MAVLPSKVAELNEQLSVDDYGNEDEYDDEDDDDRSSPGEPLPLYQQRDNYFT